MHQIIATNSRKPITYYAVLFSTGGDAELDSLLSRLGTARPASTGASHRFFFADIMGRWRSGKREAALSACYNFLAFLYDLASAPVPAHGRADSAHIERALAIMQGSIDRGLDLGTLCGRLGLSREHFVRIFSERMGIPPMRYFSLLQIEAARAMLAGTRLRVSEISEKLAFGNQYNFCRAFTRVTGMSPSAYRATCQMGERLIEKQHGDGR